MSLLISLAWYEKKLRYEKKCLIIFILFSESVSFCWWYTPSKRSVVYNGNSVKWVYFYLTLGVFTGSFPTYIYDIQEQYFDISGWGGDGPMSVFGRVTAINVLRYLTYQLIFSADIFTNYPYLTILFHFSFRDARWKSKYHFNNHWTWGKIRFFISFYFASENKFLE